jgi:subtilisin family serine protease
MLRLFGRLPTTRAMIVGAALVTLIAAPTQSAHAASEGCNAINAYPVQILSPNGPNYGWSIGMMGTFAAGDVITLTGTPSTNILFAVLEDYNDYRLTYVWGGPARFVIAPSETNAWLGWTIDPNNNAGGLKARISCTPAPIPTRACPPGTRRTIRNGKVVCVCSTGGLGVCN